MAVERPEKAAIRDLWLEQAVAYADAYAEDTDGPLYLTLGGEEARDIQKLVQGEIVRVTETGAIDPRDLRKVVAIERNPMAVLALQRRYAGLKIYEHDFPNLIQGESLMRFPTGSNEDLCRARIVNLDLNESLRVTEVDGVHGFPVLTWIQKLGQIHARRPQRDWCLCLTLHGEIRWSGAAGAAIQEFLAENFSRSPEFAKASRELLGDGLFERLSSEIPIDFARLARNLQQQVLMIFVPKKITQLVYQQGWRIETTHNLRYGGHGSAAPMVTWVCQFRWDPRVSRTPDQIYQESLVGIFSAAGQVKPDGKIVRLVS